MCLPTRNYLEKLEELGGDGLLFIVGGGDGKDTRDYWHVLEKTNKKEYNRLKKEYQLKYYNNDKEEAMEEDVECSD